MPSVIKFVLVISLGGLLTLAHPEVFHIFTASPGEPENSSPRRFQENSVEDTEKEIETPKQEPTYKEPKKRVDYFEVKPDQNGKTEPLRQKTMWASKFSESGLSSYSFADEARRLAQEYSLGALQEKMLYWYAEYHSALNQSGWTDETNYAYRQYREYEEAFEIKNRF